MSEKWDRVWDSWNSDLFSGAEIGIEPLTSGTDISRLLGKPHSVEAEFAGLVVTRRSNVTARLFSGRFGRDWAVLLSPIVRVMVGDGDALGFLRTRRDFAEVDRDEGPLVAIGTAGGGVAWIVDDIVYVDDDSDGGNTNQACTKVTNVSSIQEVFFRADPTALYCRVI